MAKSKTSSYILTLKLKTEKYQEDILNKRLEISRNIYNSCLGEILKRYKHTRELKDYRQEYKNIRI
ncbi:helix-turn-helix domain-containing protein [Clostridium botulinum]|uniref:helix-turn-helix domain-containing protein n=1 Tax=Clostridium botulinum TaxID=1491 RepID=UPI000AACA95B|nr:helix-turn-helix domain-containing protein [Clostridium botulinum]